MEITTNTIAELYIKQGYPEKAIDIYKAILELDPGNYAAVEKIQRLEAEMRGESQIAPPLEPIAVPAAEPVVQAQPVAVATTPTGNAIADQIARLENWLVNINRVRGVA